MPLRIISLHADAPAKPAEGQACNGCGVCCALETCPLARLRFLQIDGPCPALRWSADQKRYHCGLVSNPETHFGRIPKIAAPIVNRLLVRWIAAGKGCDCDADAPA